MKRLTRLLWGLGLASFIAVPLMASGPVTQLPISEFLQVQTHGVGWTDTSNFKQLYFDYAGVRATLFGLNPGTTFTGDVAERPLRGGQVHVTVDLHTKNAICWGFQYSDDSWNADTRQSIFGYAPPEVADGNPPSLGDGTMHLEFTMASGTPLPDLEVLGYPEYPQWVLEYIQADVSCTGQFRAASGYPEGTPAAAHTTQLGLYTTGVPGGCPPEKDANCSPTEIVRWWPTPRR